jgi:NADPH-dependent 2,4-dienoyl-CoA reductase/sulfur reductase-like enzyme
MSAAIAAAEAGISPLVIDENALAGGQIYRQAPPSLRRVAPNPPGGQGETLLHRFQELALAGEPEPIPGAREGIQFLNSATVWGLFPPKRLAIARGETSWTVEAEHLILAPGAYEYVPPFPGWTLPGVMTPGCAQTTAKTMNVLPGQKALIAGTGPFLLVVAEQLHRKGMTVVGVVEMAPARETLRAFPGLLAQPTLLWEGFRSLHRLRSAGIPVYWGHVLIEARGEGEVREAAIAPCDGDGRPVRGRERTVQADTVCVGYGFVPRTQLAQLAGCEMRFTEHLGGWIPTVNAEQQTSVPGIWVAGDGGGVAGALVAELEGKLVGYAVARELGAMSSTSFARLKKPVARRLAKLSRFRAALDRLYRLRPGLIGLATPDTLMCRCEELTRAEVEAGIDAGGHNLRTLKVITRLGMGPCQGRMCWPATARLLAERTRKSVESVGPLSVRPPIRPVSLGCLSETMPMNGQAQPSV